MKNLLTLILTMAVTTVLAQVTLDNQLILTGTGANAKISGIDEVSDAKDAVNVETMQKNSVRYAAATGSAGNYAISLTPAPTALTPGMFIIFKANHANTGAATLNVNGLGAVPLKKAINTALAANEIAFSQLVWAIYDGTNLQVVSPLLCVVPAFTVQPSNATICAGDNTSFSLTAVGVGLTYQWQEDQGGGFANIPNGGSNPAYTGATSASLSLNNVPAGHDQHTYRCVVTNICGSVTSNSATLTIDAPSVTADPSNATICEGANTSFSVTATGGGLTYQWQEDPNTGTFANVSNGGSNPIYAGATATSLSLTNVPVGHNQYKYRCVVSGTCAPSATSNEATLTVNAAPTITSHPSNASVNTGNNGSFSVTATGGGLTYQWQEDPNTGTFANISNGGSNPAYSGATTATLSLTVVPIGHSNYQYKCIVSGTCTPAATSNTATLSVTTDQWTLQANPFAGGGRGNAGGFVIGTKIYFGTGYGTSNSSSASNEDLWEYNPSTDLWTQKADFPGGNRAGCVSFSIGTKGYIAQTTGNPHDGVTKEYDAGSNTWTAKDNRPPKNPLFPCCGSPGHGDYPTGFAVGSFGYAGMGCASTYCDNEFWKLDPSASPGSQWTQIASYPGTTSPQGKQMATGFGLNGKGYMVGGDSNGCPCVDDCFEYDPLSDTWTQKDDYPGIRSQMFAFVIGNFAYVGAGRDGGSTKQKTVYKFDPTAAPGSQWTALNDFGGTARASVRFHGFAVGGNGYVIGGNDGSYKDDVWKYTP